MKHVNTIYPLGGGASGRKVGVRVGGDVDVDEISGEIGDGEAVGKGGMVDSGEFSGSC